VRTPIVILEDEPSSRAMTGKMNDVMLAFEQSARKVIDSSCMMARELDLCALSTASDALLDDALFLSEPNRVGTLGVGKQRENSYGHI